MAFTARSGRVPRFVHVLRVAEVEERLGIPRGRQFRFERHCFFESGLGFVGILFLRPARNEQHTIVEIGQGALGIEGYRARKVFLRLAALLLAEEKQTHALLSRRRIRIDPQCFFDLRSGSLKLVAAYVEFAERGLGFSGWNNTDGKSIGIDRVR